MAQPNGGTGRTFALQRPGKVSSVNRRALSAAAVTLLAASLLAGCGGKKSKTLPAATLVSPVTKKSTVDRKATAALQRYLDQHASGTKVTNVKLAGRKAQIIVAMKPGALSAKAARKLCATAVKAPSVDSASVFPRGKGTNPLATC